MPARPWYPHNVGDYDRKTKLLTLEQHGAYRALLDYAWDNDGLVPGDPRELALIWKVHTNRAKNLWGVLARFWYETGGGYRNKRVDQNIMEATELSEERRKAAKKRWDAIAYAKAMQATTTTTEEEDQEPLPPTAAPVDNSKGNGQSPSLWDVAREELGGPYLGKLLKEFDEKAVEEAIVATLKKRPAEWKSYLTSILRKPRRGKSMDQLALEGGYTNEAK